MVSVNVELTNEENTLIEKARKITRHSKTSFLIFSAKEKAQELIKNTITGDAEISGSDKRESDFGSPLLSDDESDESINAKLHATKNQKNILDKDSLATGNCKFNGDDEK